MSNLVGKRSKKAGLPPGTLVHIGEQKMKRVQIDMLRYTPDGYQELQLHSIDHLNELKSAPGAITWLNIEGVHDTSIMERVGKIYDIHSLVLEDIVNTQQRPKFEDYDNFLFIVFRMLNTAQSHHGIGGEQVSLLLGKKVVITFQESPGDVFDSVRERIRSGKGRIRRMGADYLAYALLDAAVDQYFYVLEEAAEKMEILEDKVLSDPDQETANQIHDLKRNMLQVRRSAWPLREVVNNFERSESLLLKKETRLFLRDVYDHAIQIIDSIEVSREIITGLLDMYLSSVSNRTNQVMKVLTIMASIFIPLTFIAGIYGMNFHKMPELAWNWGYPAALLLMLVVALGLIWYFHRKKWF